MKKIGIMMASFALPVFASAAGITNLDGVFSFISGTLNTLLPLIIAAAVVYFIYGIAMYVISGNEEAKEQAKSKIIYGVIGLFVMISVWGLVNILVGTFGLDNTIKSGAVPSLPAATTVTTP
jgi:uncharacterized membrane protein